MKTFSIETRVGKKGIIKVPQLANLENKKVRIELCVEDIEEIRNDYPTDFNKDYNPFVTAEEALAYVTKQSEGSVEKASKKCDKVVDQIFKIVEEIKNKGTVEPYTIDEMRKLRQEQMYSGFGI